MYKSFPYRWILFKYNVLLTVFSSCRNKVVNIDQVNSDIFIDRAAATIFSLKHHKHVVDRTGLVTTYENSCKLLIVYSFLKYNCSSLL